MQALAEGDLTERARKRALESPMTPTESASDQKPRWSCPAVALGRDPRLPAAGAVLRRRYRGRMVEVQVLDRGFQFEGHNMNRSCNRSEVTGTRWNGYAFFRWPVTQGKSA